MRKYAARKSWNRLVGLLWKIGVFAFVVYLLYRILPVFGPWAREFLGVVE